jgi:hypothetical protein
MHSLLGQCTVLPLVIMELEKHHADRGLLYVMRRLSDMTR